jgi:hypothetical protein
LFNSAGFGWLNGIWRQPQPEAAPQTPNMPHPFDLQQRLDAAVVLALGTGGQSGTGRRNVRTAKLFRHHQDLRKSRLYGRA